jgi:pSer/pThr/pTyr-binding forkhead associated (FHA) protein
VNNVVIVAVLVVVAIAVAAVVVWRMRGERKSGAGKLHFLTGPQQGQNYPITPGRVRIGALPDNDIVLAGDGVSRYHAEIRTRGPRAQIWDLQATNGTLVNGTTVSTSELNSGDVIQIDTIEMRYEA